jgi:hypothetical protein
MNEYDFQESMVRFLTEKKVREGIYSDDPVIQGKTGLSLEHINRLKEMDQERVEFFVSTIIHKRIDDVTRYIPYTNKLLSEEVHSLAHEFFSSGLIKSDETLEYSLAFAEYLRNEVVFESYKPFIDDLMYYEVNKLKLFIKIAKMPREESEVYLFKTNLDENTNSTVSFDFIPEFSPYHTVLKIKNDLFELFTQLDQGKTIESIPKTDLWVLIYLNNNGRIGQRIINPSTAEFIRACDGNNDITGITLKLIKSSDCSTEELFVNAKTECLKLCESLVSLGVIRAASE